MSAFPSIQLDPINKQAALLLASSPHPSKYREQPFYLDLEKKATELTKSIASMESQMKTPKPSAPGASALKIEWHQWRTKCEHNLRLAREELRTVRATIAAIGQLAASAIRAESKKRNLSESSAEDLRFLRSLKKVLRRELGDERYQALVALTLSEMTNAPKPAETPR